MAQMHSKPYTQGSHNKVDQITYLWVS